MGGIGRGAAVVAAAMVAMGTLAGCSPWAFDNGQEYEDDRTESAAVAEIKLIGGDGGVTVLRGSGTAVQIHRTVWYRDRRPTDRKDRVEGTSLLLDTRCGHNCAISYTVTVPTEVSVTGGLDTGPIELSDVGSVTVDNRDGGIVVRNASGDVTVQTDTGPIRLDRVAGTVVARTHDGGITVHTGAKTVTAQTDTGPIELSDVTGAVQARTEDGGITMERIGGQVTAETDTGPIRGTDLAGAKTLAQTADGGISLRLSTAQDVDARTVTGPIELRVPPADGGYRVTTETTTGPTAVNITTSPQGARTLTLSSQDGGITVDPA